MVIEENITGIFDMHNQCIYPIIGPKKVDCYIPKKLTHIATLADKKYVNLEGYFKYNNGDEFPYVIKVTHIEIYPAENELPTLFDLQGAAPDATGETKSEDFVRQMRDNEW